MVAEAGRSRSDTPPAKVLDWRKTPDHSIHCDIAYAFKGLILSRSRHWAALTRRITHGSSISSKINSNNKKSTSLVLSTTPRIARKMSSTTSSARDGSETPSSSSASDTMATTRKPINLHRGWPHTSLLPIAGLQKAAQAALSDPTLLTPDSALMYGPDPGYQELREALAGWLGEFYRHPVHGEGSTTKSPEGSAITDAASSITITGGASQSLANVLASFTDPSYTRGVWMVAPAYFLACPIMADAGFTDKMRAVPEDAGGVDIAFLRAGLEKMDKEGKQEEEEKPKYKNPKPYRKIYRHVIYCVPTFANPSGKTMSLRRRTELVELARDFDALVVADDVYDMLQWSTSPPSHNNTTPPPAAAADSGGVSSTAAAAAVEHDFSRALLPRLVDIDIALGPSKFDAPITRTSPSTSTPTPIKHFGHAISNGSFSKLAGPGLRTGWTQSSPDFALGLSQTGATRSGGAPSQMMASVVNQLLRSGDLQAQIETALRPGFRERHRLMMRAVQEELVDKFGVLVGEGQLLEFAGAADGGAESRGVFGGYFIWLTLPSHSSDGRLFPGGKAIAVQCLRDEGLIIGHGGMFEVQGDEDAVRLDHAIRLCFAWEEEENLAEGIKRLGRIVGRMLEEGPESWKAVVGPSGGDSANEQK